MQHHTTVHNALTKFHNHKPNTDNLQNHSLQNHKPKLNWSQELNPCFHITTVMNQTQFKWI